MEILRVLVSLPSKLAGNSVVSFVMLLVLPFLNMTHIKLILNSYSFDSY